MYIPTDAISLNKQELPLFRIALQAPGGRGKTFTGLTFPNVTVLNYDNNLQAFQGRSDIYQVPFWQDSLIDKLVPRGNTLDSSANPKIMRPNRRDALIKWLNIEGSKFTPDQTIFLDSWTKAQDGFDIQQDIEPHYTKEGNIDEYAFWEYKQDWSRDLCELLSSLNCNVIVSFHENRLTDSKGNIVDGKFIPLQQGKFVNRLSLYFSEWYRVYYFPKGTPLKEINPTAIVEYMGLKHDPIIADLGVWQTKSNIYADCKTRIISCPPFIEASYKNLMTLCENNKKSS